VFTREDIDRLQPDSVTDLLRRVPGVQVAQAGGRGSLPGIYIRGTNRRRAWCWWTANASATRPPATATCNTSTSSRSSGWKCCAARARRFTAAMRLAG
jgi:hypothetical protein